MSSVTLTDLETICHQVTALHPKGTEGFRPTPKQVYFFVLVWLLKNKKSWGQLEELTLGQEVGALTGRAQLVVHHLVDWGLALTRLKAGDEKEWELLRIQVEKAIKYYPGPSPELKADALQNALLRLYNLLNKMVAWPQLEAADIPALVRQSHPTLTNIYDFGSPFYAFAKRLTQNELFSQLRAEGRRPLYPIPLEDMNELLPAPSPTQQLELQDETALQMFCLQLKIDMARLLEIILSRLTPKPAQVMLQTLEGRREFWRILETTGLAAPAGLSPQPSLLTDAAIARALGMTENNVRVHRTHAKNLVRTIDPAAGLLLESLLVRHGTISYRPEI